ncbi:MAG: serine/threonine-protein kinase [Planctomycetota bacterium]
MRPARTETDLREAESASQVEEVVNDRFRVVRYLGRGGMGDVCLVRDSLQGGRALALKRLRRDKIEPRTVAILRSEYLALNSLSHPNLIRAFDFGVDRATGDLFFTEEFVDGRSWLEASRGVDLRTDAGLERLLGVLAQVLRALEFIHAHGLVHGDVKPENILVGPSGPAGGAARLSEAVKIIDFGLVRKQGAPREEKILGTPYYVPPETILGAPADSRSDLYSLGAVLYHICVGRPPFTGDSNLAILRNHIEKAPPAPHEAARGLSPKLGELILRLLEKKPEDRFDSALGVIEHVNGVFGAAIPLETPETAQAYLEAGTVAGREGERVEIHKVFSLALGFDAVSLASVMDSPGQGGWASYAAEIEAASAALPPGRLLLIRGERGLGKRRVVGELKTIAETLGARFLPVDCSEHHESHAGGLESLLNQLTRFEWHEWKDGLPPRLQTALLLGGASEDAGEPGRREETRAALRELAAALLESSQDQPNVLCFQDVHLACGVVADFVRELAGTAGGEPGSHRRFLAIGTCPDRGAAGEGAFAKLCEEDWFRDRVLEVRLPRLTERSIVSFVESLLPRIELPAEFALRVLEESDGIPGVVVGILGHFLRQRNIRRRVNGWDLVGDFEDADFPGKSRGELGQRLSNLVPEALRLAKAFACLGERGYLDLAARLAGLNPRDAVASLSALAAERIVQRLDDAYDRDVFGFVHSSCRAFVYRSMEEEERRGYHRAAGELLEKRGAGDRELARHFLAAWEAERGLRYGLAAARALRQGGTLPDAVNVYERVYAVALSAGAAVAAEAARELARLRFEVGDYRGVLELCSSAPRDLGRANGEAALLVLGARAAARLGQAESCRLFLEGLEGRGAAPRSGAARLAAAEAHFLEDRFVEALRECRGLLEGPEIADRGLRLWLHALAAETCSALEHREEAARHCQLVLRSLDAEAESEGMARALFWRGKYYVCRGQFEKAKKQFKLSLLLSGRCGALGLRADSLYELGAVQHRQGWDDEAVVALEEALKAYRQQGYRSRRRWSAVLLADAHRRAGARAQCGQLIREAFLDASDPTAGPLAAASLVTVAALARDAGDFPKARECLRKAEASRRWVTDAANVFLAADLLECEMAFEAGDLRGALETAAHGLLRSREVDDVDFEAQFLVLRAKLFDRLGADARAKRSLIAAFDLADTHDLALTRSRGLLVQARMLARLGDASGAQRLFDEAKGLLARVGSRRALMELQHEHGMVCLAEGKHEDAYLQLEEGLHAATTLERAYETCLFHFAMGRLEFAIDPSSPARSLHHLIEAARLAMKGGYRDVLWRVQLQTREVFRRAEWQEKAEVQSRAARKTLEMVLGSVPSEFRETFLETARREERADIAELIAVESQAGGS